MWLWQLSSEVENHYSLSVWSQVTHQVHHHIDNWHITPWFLTESSTFIMSIHAARTCNIPGQIHTYMHAYIHTSFPSSLVSAGVTFSFASSTCFHHLQNPINQASLPASVQSIYCLAFPSIDQETQLNHLQRSMKMVWIHFLQAINYRINLCFVFQQLTLSDSNKQGSKVNCLNLCNSSPSFRIKRVSMALTKSIQALP
jgi:hypothetical protein